MTASFSRCKSEKHCKQRKKWRGHPLDFRKDIAIFDSRLDTDIDNEIALAKDDDEEEGEKDESLETVIAAEDVRKEGDDHADANGTKDQIEVGDGDAHHDDVPNMHDVGNIEHSEEDGNISNKNDVNYANDVSEDAVVDLTKDHDEVEIEAANDDVIDAADLGEVADTSLGMDVHATTQNEGQNDTVKDTGFPDALSKAISDVPQDYSAPLTPDKKSDLEFVINNMPMTDTTTKFDQRDSEADRVFDQRSSIDDAMLKSEPKMAEKGTQTESMFTDFSRQVECFMEACKEKFFWKFCLNFFGKVRKCMFLYLLSEVE